MADSMVNVSVKLDWQIAVSILERVAEVIAPLDDPEEIRGVVAVLTDGVREMAENESHN